MKVRHTLTVVLALGVGAAGLASCGSSTDLGPSGVTASTVAQPAESGTSVTGTPGKVYYAWADVSYSTVDVRASYLPDMVLFARRAALDGAAFYADAFGGAPLHETDWPVHEDFSIKKPGLGGNKLLERQERANRAARLEPALRKVLASQTTDSGTPFLEVLGVTASMVEQHPGSAAVIGLFTDGGLVEEDYDVGATVTPEQQAAVVATWKPRLAVLRGAQVYVAGVGRGTDLRYEQLMGVRSLLGDVLHAVGARLVVFDVRLAQEAHG